MSARFSAARGFVGVAVAGGALPALLALLESKNHHAPMINTAAAIKLRARVR